jgi:hypothetical protein
MTNYAKLTVSLVLYNTPLWQIERALRVLQDVPSCSEVYLIDNSPSKITASEFDMANFSAFCEIIPNDNNGYVAHNIGIRRAITGGSFFHLVLNADVSFVAEDLEKMIQIMVVNKDVGLLFPKVVYPDGRNQRLAKRLPNPLELMLRLCGLGNLPGFDVTSASDAKCPVRISFASGCFMLVRTDVFRKVGLMDERFFMYGEDIDLSRRIAAESELVYVPSFEIKHDFDGLSKRNLKMFFIHVMNVIRYFNKWGWLLDTDRKKIIDSHKSEPNYPLVVKS